MAKKKTTLNDLAQLIEKGFTAVASDIADLRTELTGDIGGCSSRSTQSKASSG